MILLDSHILICESHSVNKEIFKNVDMLVPCIISSKATSLTCHGDLHLPLFRYCQYLSKVVYPVVYPQKNDFILPNIRSPLSSHILKVIFPPSSFVFNRHISPVLNAINLNIMDDNVINGDIGGQVLLFHYFLSCRSLLPPSSFVTTDTFYRFLTPSL
jgi:hypothetical protein